MPSALIYYNAYIAPCCAQMNRDPLGGLLFASVMKYLLAMESDDEFKRLLDSFIEEMREQDQRSFGFRELAAYLRANNWDDALTAGQEAAVFKRFGDHYDLKRWAIGKPRWSFIDG